MSAVDTISMLNRLIVVAKDGEDALRAAAEEAHHTDVRAALLEFSVFLQQAVPELQSNVRALGGNPKELGSFGNTLHRAWVHLRAMALGRREDVLLDDVESDEALAEQLFAEAATWDTTADIHASLQRLSDGVRLHHQALRDLRQRWPVAA